MSNTARGGSVTRIPLHLQFLADREGFCRRLLGKEDLVEDVTSILHGHNPSGLADVDHAEYRVEAQTIAASVDRYTTPPETLNIAHREFVHWFDPEMAGPPVRYTRIAADVWRAIQHRLTPRSMVELRLPALDLGAASDRSYG